MSDELLIYFQLGLEHITDPNGYDHILFVVALSIVFLIKEWRELAVLVTAFTIGHSLTLALSVLDVVRTDSAFIEFLIPITILFTALFNFYSENLRDKRDMSVKNRYAVASFFGLVHGLGFAGYLRELIQSSEELLMPLLSFNIGLEVGQLLIVGFTFLTGYLVCDLMKVKRSHFVMAVSTVIGLISLRLIFLNWYF